MSTTDGEETQYVLDTNVLIHAVRAKETWGRIKAICDPLMAEPRPLYSIVSEAELISFERQQNWAAPKIQQASFFLSYFVRVTIDDPKIIRTYAAIDTFSRFLPGGGIKMGKNDLWIAATANVYNAVLVTTDRDFEHLHGQYLTRILVS